MQPIPKTSLEENSLNSSNDPQDERPKARLDLWEDGTIYQDLYQWAVERAALRKQQAEATTSRSR